MKEIYFFSLDETLRGIGESIELEMSINTPPRKEFVTAWRWSRAAEILHQVLHNVREGRPQWMIMHPITRRPVATDDAPAEGIRLLEDISGWSSRFWKGYFAFPRITYDYATETPTELQIARVFSQSKFVKQVHGREHFVGFDRERLIYYLDSPEVDIPHRIRGDLPYEYIMARDARQRSRADTAQRTPAPPSADPASESPKEAVRDVPRLALPANADAWAKAIAATFDLLVSETGTAPTGTELWLRMNDRPPPNYPITATRDYGLPAIALPGERPLTREGFAKRWRRYTAEG